MTASVSPDADTEPPPIRAPATAHLAEPLAQGAAGAPDVEMIEVTKRFGTVTAVDAMNLSIARGASYSLLGPRPCG